MLNVHDRDLLSHSSGVAYAPLSPHLVKLRLAQDRTVEQSSDNIDENFTYPLIFDPGTDWAYGPGLDWCTRLITRASHEDSDAYLQSHMAKPLGIRSGEMTFNLQAYPGHHARHADVVLIVGEGSSRRFSHDDATQYWNRVEEPSGGQGIFCTPRAYMEVLWSVLIDDGRLLKPETRKLLFEPALGPEAQQGLDRRFEALKAFHIGAPIPLSIPKSHSVGGLLAMADCDSDDFDAWRRKGSLSWAGACNIFWVSG